MRSEGGEKGRGVEVRKWWEDKEGKWKEGGGVESDSHLTFADRPIAFSNPNISCSCSR
jgi:hypothetical protein